MTVHQRKQLMSRTIRGERISRRMVAVEPILAILIGSKLATQVIGSLVLRVLEVVFAIGASLPDVKDSAGDRLSGKKISNGAVHLAHSAVGIGVLDDGAAVLAERSVGRPERSEDRRRSRVNVAFCNDFVGDFIDEAANICQFVLHETVGALETYDSRPRTSETR